jgi:hypothetical protein
VSRRELDSPSIESATRPTPMCNQNQTKALIEALIAKVTITAPDRLVPVFRIPQPGQPRRSQPSHCGRTAAQCGGSRND